MKGYYDDKRKEAEKLEKLLQDYEGTISKLDHENYILREVLEQLQQIGGEVAIVCRETLNKLQK